MKRNTIKDIPSVSEEDYYVFKIEAWDKLYRKIEVKGNQVGRLIYTTEYLLHNAVIVIELCIKSKEEYRLWRELKRISSFTETEIGERIDKDSRIKGFSIEGMKIFIKDEEIKVEYNGKSYGFSRGEFERKPRGVIERIIDIGRGCSKLGCTLKT
ncbi:hypothetical protein [Clostridium estertheticum]|uniref:hypothetical protein n=1 Tax=Clostridium estertheticum TaxID=238834 RepID=UPI001C0BBDEA|nr:hypothetical protein [Clostridium estertheticum]MBU3072519.1 hypothetical protein [Clostridium estertheticum]MBU3162612.1 hypothetical protein [Clostridium estertheticum]